MTTTIATIHHLPTPRPTRFAAVRDSAPELADDLIDLWDLADRLDGDHAIATHLRAIVEHLAGGVEWLVIQLGRWEGEQPCACWRGPDDPIIYPDEWSQSAPGRWEVEATAGGGAWEATVTPTGTDWTWRLWHRVDAGPLVAIGPPAQAPTLAAAQRAVEAAIARTLRELREAGRRETGPAIAEVGR